MSKASVMLAAIAMAMFIAPTAGVSSASDDDRKESPRKDPFVGFRAKRYQQHRTIWDPKFAESPGDKWMQLDEYLSQCGDRLHCHFTFEVVEHTADAISALQAAGIMAVDVSSVDALIQKLRQDLDGVTVELSRAKPPVIRLVETQLIMRKDYPLHRRISLNFSGRLADMLAEMRKQGSNVGDLRGSGIPAPPIDGVTETKIAVQDKRILEVLTDAVPMTATRPILWHATTRQTVGKPTTEVYYLAPSDL